MEAKDQYGEDMTLDDGLFEWRLATDKGYAEISGSVITGLVVGTDTVTLYYPVGQYEQGETVYRTAQPLPVQVAHCSMRSTVSSFSQPKAASVKLRDTLTRMLSPR